MKLMEEQRGMEVVHEIDAMRQLRRAAPELSWGLVPTMGSLHEGHLSLVRRARAENDRVAVSIFVNPAQFDRAADLESYPRNLEQDCRLLEREGVTAVFAPSAAAMYPPGYQSYIEVEELARPLEGAARGGHFRGVATVVAKLFHIVEPARAYFGQKDAQQVTVVRRMVTDLDFPLQLVVCATSRHADGLARSSRNALLTSEQRRAAPALFRALQAARRALAGGERCGDRLRGVMTELLEREALARIDYVSAADPASLQELETVGDEVLLSLAVFFGDTRLIDNFPLRGPEWAAPGGVSP